MIFAQISDSRVRAYCGTIADKAQIDAARKIIIKMKGGLWELAFVNHSVLEFKRVADAGYCVVSRKHKTVSRIDRPDWREYMAAKHAPWDPMGEGMAWARTSGSADHYRRLYSKDTKIVTDLGAYPSSGEGPTEYMETVERNTKETTQMQKFYTLADRDAQTTTGRGRRIPTIAEAVAEAERRVKEGMTPAIYIMEAVKLVQLVTPKTEVIDVLLSPADCVVLAAEPPKDHSHDAPGVLILDNLVGAGAEKVTVCVPSFISDSDAAAIVAERTKILAFVGRKPHTLQDCRHRPGWRHVTFVL